MFQSRSGFSGRLDRTTILNAIRLEQVSIPFWVFWSSRRPGGFRDLSGRFRFNPVLGFLVVSTLVLILIPCQVLLFQSRSGFSGRLDPDFSMREAEAVIRFNPVLGFLVVST